MELRFEKEKQASTGSKKTASSNSVVAQRSLSGGHRRVGRWASLRRHKLPDDDDDDVEDDDELVMHVPGGQRGGAIHGSLRHFKSIPSNSPSPAARTARSDKVKKKKKKLPPEAKVDKRAKPNKTTTAATKTTAKAGKKTETKAKEAETETEDEEPTRIRVVRAFGLSRSGKHKVSSDLVPPSSTSGSHSSIGGGGGSSRDQERAAPYYCVVQVAPVERKGQPPVRTPPTRKTPPLLRTTLEGRLCNYGGLRVEEVEWDQAVEIPSDGPQELVVEFRVYARRRYLPDRLVGRAELSLRGGQRVLPPNKRAVRQRFRTLVLEKGDAEPRALLEIIFDPPHSQRPAPGSPKPEWPFLCSGVEAVRLLAYGRGDMHLERSFLGTLPPELVERLCELVEHNTGFDPFRDGEATPAAQRDRQFLADTMRQRATSATHRWKVMRVRSVPAHALARQSMGATSASPSRSLCLPQNALGPARPRTSSMDVQVTPDESSVAAVVGPASPFLSRPVVSSSAATPHRYTSLFFWHPQDLEDPVIVRGSRRKGYLTCRAVEAGNEHTMTDKHTVCYLQSTSRSDQTFMMREFKEAAHKAFVWNEDTLADYVQAIEKRLQTVAILEQQRRMLIGGVPALGCTFAISVPARAVHTVHKRGLREYELVSVWFVIIDRSCFQFQFTTCTQNPSQSLCAALLAHRKVEESNFLWMLRSFGWRHEVYPPRNKQAPPPPQPATSPSCS